MSPSSSSAAAAAAADLEHEHEYSDEEQLATVTVVEDFDPSVLLYHPTASGAELPADLERPSPPPQPLSLSLSRENLKASRKDDGLATATATKKLKKVRYETKVARKATRATQRARRTEKAERAGGKAARKKASALRRRRVLEFAVRVHDTQPLIGEAREPDAYGHLEPFSNLLHGPPPETLLGSEAEMTHVHVVRIGVSMWFTTSCAGLLSE